MIYQKHCHCVVVSTEKNNCSSQQANVLSFLCTQVILVFWTLGNKDLVSALIWWTIRSTAAGFLPHEADDFSETEIHDRYVMEQ